jgi:CheY-like chemotaxis protein
MGTMRHADSAHLCPTECDARRREKSAAAAKCRIHLRRDLAYNRFMGFSSHVGDGGHRRILVVEDDADLRASVAQTLQEEGYEVDVARNGRDALEALTRSAPDLVLLDLMMPVMSGWEFRERQRNHPQYGHIPVVVMTATSTLEAAAIDATDLLPKPLALEELLSVVRRYAGTPWIADFEDGSKTEPNAPKPVFDEPSGETSSHH